MWQGEEVASPVNGNSTRTKGAVKQRYLSVMFKIVAALAADEAGIDHISLCGPLSTQQISLLL